MNFKLLKQKVSLLPFQMNETARRALAGIGKLVAASLAVLGIAPTFCGDTDINAVGSNVITATFNILRLGGIILTAVGVVQLVRAIMEASQGQSQPGAVGKALGMIIGGVVMIVIPSVLEALGVSTEWSLTGT